jgi:hypothetical protein
MPLKKKSPLRTPVIDPGTFRLVAQRLYTTTLPQTLLIKIYSLKFENGRIFLRAVW